MESNDEWIDITKEWPPFETFSCEELRNTMTIDIEAKTMDHGIVETYHDGDVWCHANLSGCPQYRVTHWRLIKTRSTS